MLFCARIMVRVTKGLAVACLVLLSGPTTSRAASHTWTNKTTGVQDWNTVVNWDVGGVYASDPANELVIYPDVNALPVGFVQTISSVPAELSMNTLTLNGRSPNEINGATVYFGDGTSVWTIGDGTTSLITHNAVQHSFDYRSVFYHLPNIVLNQATTTITGNGTSAGFYFKGNITEAAAGYGITKSGSSRAFFFGTNTYTGPTAVNGGILRLSSASALPGGTGQSGGTSALTLNGGVLELAAADFQRGLGTGSAQFQILGGTSGFGAKGAHRYVKVNNDASQELVWGSTDFQPGTLALNYSLITDGNAGREEDRTDNNITIFNNMDLNGATRTAEVNSYSAAFPGVIRNSTGTAGLTKTGNGMLVLSGANTYNGDTTITGGMLSMGAANNAGAGSSGIIFNGGGLQIRGTSLTSLSGIGHAVTFNANKTVTFDIEDAANTFTVDQALTQGSGELWKLGNGTLTVNQACTFTGETEIYGGNLVLDYSTADSSKLSDSASLKLYGGTITLVGGTHTEVVKDIVILPYSGNFINRSSGSAVMNLNVITRSASRSSLSFSEAGIATTDTPNDASGVLGGWVTVGSHLAMNSTGGADGSITNYSAYTPFVTSGGGYGTNYQLQGSATVDASQTMGTLRIENTADDQVLDLQNYYLQIENHNTSPGGVILYAGGANGNYTITGTTGYLNCRNGSQSFGINTYTGTLTLDCKLSSGIGQLVKTGAGTLAVTRDSGTIPTATLIQQGVLRMSDSYALGTTGGIGVQGGAALELINNITVGSKALTIAGTGISNGGALRNVSGNNSYGGSITVSGVYGGAITGSGGSVRINSDSGTLTLTGDITTLSNVYILGSRSDNLTFGGAGNITVSNATVTALGITKDGSGTLGIVVDDGSSAQWTCGAMELNNSTLALTFNTQPSTNEPVIKVVGDLVFDGTPTISISVDPADISYGKQYSLIEVAGGVPPGVPAIDGVVGTLRWSGAGNGTLVLDTTPSGTLIIIR